jgi:hypothetical protein
MTSSAMNKMPYLSHKVRTPRKSPLVSAIAPPVAFGRAGGQALAQLLGHVSGEKGGVGAGVAVDLAVDRAQDVGVAMAQREHGRAAAGVDVGVAFRCRAPGCPAR